MKEEALKLADQVDEGYAFIERKHLSGMIRRLVEELEKQK
jgi:hypothetical protein